MKIDKSILNIDKHKLDMECETHANTLFSISEEVVEAQEKRDAYKVLVEETYAQVDADLRANANNKGEKITEAKLANSILLDNSYKMVYNTYLEAKAEYDKLYALKEAYISRGVMLRTLCELYISGYWGGITVKGNTTQGIKDIKYKETLENISKGKSAKAKTN